MRPRLRGRWGSAAGVTVEEVWTYCTAADFRNERLRKEAAERGIKQSTLVEEALQSALA